MKPLKILLVIVILGLNLLLHLHNYTQYPQRGASSDEYTYSFLGQSLLTKHLPISWSAIPAYKHRYDLTINGIYFPIVYPYFDHPPLNGLLVGGWALLNGENTFEKISLETIRIIPIFLTVISTLLLFLLANKLFSYQTALWAMLIYSTTTIFVMNTRVVFAENLLTPIFLLAIYLFAVFDKRLNTGKTLLLGILAGLSFWTKELGIVTFFTIGFFFLYTKINWKYTALFIVTSGIFFAGYLLYGYYYDWHVFLNVIHIQGDRPVGPEVLYMLLFQPIIVNKQYMDGWYFLGFVAFFLTFMDVKKYFYILVGPFIYVLLMIFSLNKEGEMGWYLIPLFPFMSIAIATLLVESFEKRQWFVYVFLTFIGLYEMKYAYGQMFGLTTTQFRIFLIVMYAPFLLLSAFGKEQAFVKLEKFWFYLLIIGNIFITYNYIHPA